MQLHLRRFLLILAGLLATLTAPRWAWADVVLGGNDPVPRSYVDTATGALFFDFNNPISANGTIDSWEIYTANSTGVGQVELEIFRPGSTTWQFIGASPLETVAWNSLNTFSLPTPIPVEAGDLVSFWYPHGTVPSILYDPTGQTLNNHDWPTDPIPETHTDIPDLLTTNWHGPWDMNPRTYSIQVLGTAAVPEPSSLVLAGIGGAALLVLARYRQGR